MKSGEKIRLEDGHDVSDDNDGVIVMVGGEPKHILWSKIDRIEID